MNAYSRTAQALSFALLGRCRSTQDVHILTKRYGGPIGPRYTVLVDHEYYDCGQHILDALLMGMSPAELEIEPSNPDAEEDE